MTKPQICRITNIPFFFCHHLRSQIEASVREGYDVHLICSEGPGDDELRRMPGVTFYPIEITRKISPWKDLVALWKIYRYLRQRRFEIVHTATSKAGLLGAIAAKLARIPVRLHNFSGQPWISLSGGLRLLMLSFDRWIVRLNSRCYSDSRSQSDLLSNYKICTPSQLRVLGEGSIAGVDLQRFNPETWSTERDKIRAALNIPVGEKVVTFVGRMTTEKGVVELLEAFQDLTEEGVDAYLIMVGPLEKERFPIPQQTFRMMQAHPRVRFVGYSSEPEYYLAISDLFCLPSYRESFGIAVIEAAAMGVPAIVARVSGLVDAVVDGETGLMVPPKDSASLKRALLYLLTDTEARQLMGRKAQVRARRLFDQNIINKHLLKEYEELLAFHSTVNPCAEY
jgi:glycosyltransferase involved in cell wall biosynthesis